VPLALGRVHDVLDSYFVADPQIVTDRSSGSSVTAKSFERGM
jgi:hypothetical protein